VFDQFIDLISGGLLRTYIVSTCFRAADGSS